MIKTTLGLRIIASIVIVFGSAGMYFTWNTIHEPGQNMQEQNDTVYTPTGDTNEPLVSDYVPPTSTDPTSQEKITPSDPTPHEKLVPTPAAITCDEIKEATFKKCRADCPAEADIAVYHECTAGCDKIGNLLDKSDCINKCISDWSKAQSARSDCTAACLDDYYATDCP